MELDGALVLRKVIVYLLLEGLELAREELKVLLDD